MRRKVQYVILVLIALFGIGYLWYQKSEAAVTRDLRSLSTQLVALYRATPQGTCDPAIDAQIEAARLAVLKAVDAFEVEVKRHPLVMETFSARHQEVQDASDQHYQLVMKCPQ